ncbi:hypothetical protein P389DRAFT_169973 [Cystobasidium minutum MCA 4210]|uniref:uncharacterized protein n=1 Tax=Cystobasidium minutum MCA 4210 TaxID=1397322 RepID=UPI0034CE6178|eukprot:jgi/Rhomi1/169973/fgenesh1_kg.3_\
MQITPSRQVPPNGKPQQGPVITNTPMSECKFGRRKDMHMPLDHEIKGVPLNYGQYQGSNTSWPLVKNALPVGRPDVPPIPAPSQPAGTRTTPRHRSRSPAPVRGTSRERQNVSNGESLEHKPPSQTCSASSSTGHTVYRDYRDPEREWFETVFEGLMER